MCAEKGGWGGGEKRDKAIGQQATNCSTLTVITLDNYRLSENLLIFLITSSPSDLT